jgi:two-component system, chemotaxis family, chemotaxis protein CheY
VKALVVDDDDAIVQFLQMALTDNGYEVVTAGDGWAALDLARQSPPDVIFLDMRMPGMDGWTFARLYREGTGPHAPIVVLTAARDAGVFAAQIEADAFLAKPFELKELLRLAQRYGSARTPPAGGRDS